MMMPFMVGFVMSGCASFDCPDKDVECGPVGSLAFWPGLISVTVNISGLEGEIVYTIGGSGDTIFGMIAPEDGTSDIWLAGSFINCTGGQNISRVERIPTSCA